MATHDNTPSATTLAAVLEACRWYYTRFGVVPPAAELARLIGMERSYIYHSLKALEGRGLLLRPFPLGGYVPAEDAPQGAAELAARLAPLEEA